MAGDETCQVSCSLRGPVTVKTPDSYSETAPTHPHLQPCASLLSSLSVSNFLSAFVFCPWSPFINNFTCFSIKKDFSTAYTVINSIQKYDVWIRLLILHLEISTNRIYNAAVQLAGIITVTTSYIIWTEEDLNKCSAKGIKVWILTEGEKLCW